MEKQDISLLVFGDRTKDKKFEKLFSDEKYKADYIPNKEKALETLTNNPEKYSALILDSSPVDNYLDLLSKLNANSSLKTIPVIMRSNNQNQNEVEKGLRAGARYCIFNEFNDSLIIATINAAIRDKQKYDVAKNNSDSAFEIPKNLAFANFKIRHFDEATSIAGYISKACPNPNLAVVGISEILLNAIEHGNLGISYALKTKLNKEDRWLMEVERRLNLPENINKFVNIDYKRDDNQISIEIRDEGEGFDWKKHQNEEAKRQLDNHGRGILMAKSLAFDTLEYKGKGNIVLCTINLNKTIH